MKFLKIGNTDVSHLIKSLSITHEIVWDTNAGRTMTADFVGDIIAKKWKLNCTTIPLTQEESATLMNLIEASPFMSVSFIPTNTTSSQMITKTFYVSTPSHEVYRYVDKLVRYSSLAFNLIEQ